MCVGGTSGGQLLPRGLFPMYRVLSASAPAAVHRRRTLAASLYHRLRQVHIHLRYSFYVPPTQSFAAVELPPPFAEETV